MTLSVGIVGAGPAGSFCAARLAAGGAAVTLYDDSHPREKPCGGGVTAGVFGRWPELEAVRAVGRPSTAVRMRGPRGRLVSFGLDDPIWIFARRELDGWLLEQARAVGARHVPVRVRAVARSGERGGVELDLGSGTAHHDVVVGADGASSIVRRAFGAGLPLGWGTYATAGYFVEGLDEGEIHVEFPRAFAGYLWAFPRPGHASVGIAAPLGRESGRQLRERVLRFLGERYPGSLALPRRAYGAAIPVARGRIAGPRFALVGDAAGANDALTGEGIHYAIDSAGMLAAALLEAGPVEGPARYARRWRAGPGAELALGAAFARLLYRPLTVDVSLALAARSERLRRLMAAMPTEERPYRGLPRRLAGLLVP